MTLEYEELMEDLKKAKEQQAPIVRHLQEQWQRACNEWILELCNRWDLDPRYGYWVGDDVGGTWLYGDDLPLGMDEVRYAVAEGIGEREFREWLDYCSDAHEFNMTQPNIEAWHRGCPRTSQETFAHLRQLRAQLDEAVQVEKDRINSF